MSWFPPFSQMRFQLLHQSSQQLFPPLTCRFFCEAYGAPSSGEKPRLRVPSRLKEVLQAHLDKMEQRLLNDQKRLAQFRRVSKAQENVLSEEEKKKKRKLRKVRPGGEVHWGAWGVWLAGFLIFVLVCRD